MEKMVSDPNISKVVIISDRMYCEKANSRTGGAGTEAQIISKEIFAKQNQDKFVVAVAELDDDGKPYVPTYYTSRIFIDFSDESKFSTSFEQLLRWIADKPIHKKPELGSLPKYITAPEEAVTLATTSAKRRAQEALTNSKGFSYPASKEYFELFSREIEKFRLRADFDPLSDEILDNFASFAPYRDEFLEIVRTIANYADDPRYGALIHSFFERFQDYFYPPPGTRQYRELDFGNFRFFAQELFLHTAATLISESRYDLFNYLIETPYFFSRRAERGHDPLGRFTEFRDRNTLLAYRNQELKLGRISLTADMLRDRTSTSGTNFSNLMQVDFILFLRAELLNLGIYESWWPDTLVFLGHRYRTLEIFERSRSKSYFERIRPILGNATKEDLENFVESYRGDERSLPRWEGTRLSPSSLMGLQNLCSQA